MRIRLSVIAFVFALMLVLAAAAQASVPVQTVVSFDPAAGQFPEGLAVDSGNNAYVSLVAPVSEIRKIDPSGDQSTVAHFNVPGLGPLGLVVRPSGALYVALSTLDPATRGVYRVMPDGGSARLAGSDAILFPNGLAADPRGNLYVTDSIAGAVWKIHGADPAQLWVESPLLAGTGALGLGFPLGANGIAVRNHVVVVTNTEGSSVVRIPIARDGSAGPLSVLAQGPALFGADGLALDVFGNCYIAVNPQNTLIRMDRQGSMEVLATAADGLDNPASLAFGTSHGDRKALFITNFAIFSAAPTPGLLKALVNVPGQPIR